MNIKELKEQKANIEKEIIKIEEEIRWHEERMAEHPELKEMFEREIKKLKGE